jgi:hypothetical protein
MSNAVELEKYFEERLFSDNNLQKYLKESAVVSVELDQALVFDLMVFIPDRLFNEEFKPQFGECFVVNDQARLPPVFTRFKSYQWLRRDLSGRLPIALWIFGQSIIVQDPEKAFETIIGEYTNLFKESLESIIQRKYIEFRSDRHNLRQAVYHKEELAINLLKANVVKIAIEIFFLAHNKPYPYKKWLSIEGKKFEHGSEFVGMCDNFIKETDFDKIIVLSDNLVNEIADLLASHGNFSPSLLHQWWLHLV